MKICLKTDELYDILYDLNVLPGKFILLHFEKDKIIFSKMHLFNKVLFKRTLDITIKEKYTKTTFMLESTKLLNVLKDFRELDINILFDLNNNLMVLDVHNDILNINCQISLTTYSAEYPYIFNNYTNYFEITSNKKIKLNTLKIKSYLKNSILNTNTKNIKENTVNNTLQLTFKDKRFSIVLAKNDYIYYSGKDVRNLVIQNDFKDIFVCFPVNILKMLLKIIKYKNNAILDISFSNDHKIIKINIDNLSLYFEIPTINFPNYENIIFNYESKQNNHISLLTFDVYTQLKPFLINKNNDYIVDIYKNKFVVYNSFLKTELYCFAEKSLLNLRINIKNLLLYIEFIKTNKYINMYYNPKYKTYLLTNNKTREIIITF